MNRGERRRQTRAGMFTGTGIVVEAVSKYHNDTSFPAQKPGEHLWNLVAMFRVAAPAGGDRFNLDLENLITIEGPGCYWCEQMWSREVAAAPCRGSGPVADAIAGLR